MADCANCGVEVDRPGTMACNGWIIVIISQSRDSRLSFECLEIVPVEYNQAFAVVQNWHSRLRLRVMVLGEML